MRIMQEPSVHKKSSELTVQISILWGQVTNGASDAITHFGFKMIRLCHVKSEVCQKYVSLPKGFGQQWQVEIL